MPLRPLSVAALLVAIAPAARAVPPHVVELQLDTDVLSALVIDRAQSLDLPCPTPIDLGDGDVIINHVSFDVPYEEPFFLWGAPVLHTFSDGSTVLASPPQVVVPVGLHTKSLACALDPACDPLATDTLPVPLAFDITATADEVCATYAGPYLAVDEATEDAIDAVAAEFGSLCAPLDFGAVTALLGADFPVVDVAVSGTTDLTRLAVRLELGGAPGVDYAPLDSWVAFLVDNELAPSDPESDFSLFVDQFVLRKAIADRIVSGMVCESPILDPGDSGCTDGIEPTSTPITTWNTWIPSAPRIELFVDAELEVDLDPEGADVAWGCPNTIGLEPISFSAPLTLAPTGDAIEVNAAIDWTLDAWNVLECGLANVIPSGFPLISLAVLEGIAANYTDEDALGQALPSECDLVDDTHVNCSYGFVLPELSLGTSLHATLTAESLTGDPEGLLLEGSAVLSGGDAGPMEPLTLGGSVPELDVWGNCEEGFHLGYVSWLDIDGSSGLFCDDPVSLVPTPMDVGDKLGRFTLTTEAAGPPGDAEVRFTPSALYWQNPYPLVATVFSTVGSGSIALGTPTEPPKFTGIDPMLLEWAHAQSGCWEEETGMFGLPGHFNVEWLVDPPPYTVAISAGSRLTGTPSATLSAVSVVQTTAPLVDGTLVTAPANSLALTGRMTVTAAPYSVFSADVSVPIPIALEGSRTESRAGALDTLVATSGFEVSVDMPASSLPRGMTRATVLVTLDPGDFVLAGPSIAPPQR